MYRRIARGLMEEHDRQADAISAFLDKHRDILDPLEAAQGG
jgi:hypothetical protein